MYRYAMRLLALWKRNLIFAFERYCTYKLFDVNNHEHLMNYMLLFVKKEKIKNRILGANVKYTFTVEETDGGRGIGSLTEN